MASVPPRYANSDRSNLFLHSYWPPTPLSSPQKGYQTTHTERERARSPYNSLSPPPPPPPPPPQQTLTSPTLMSSSHFCTICQTSSNACPHCIADLNRAVAGHDGPEGLQEFQFFSNEDTLAWLFNDSKAGPEGNTPEEIARPMQAGAGRGFNYFEGLRGSCNPGRLTLDVCLSGTSSPDSMVRQSPSVDVSPAAMGHVGSSGNVVSILASSTSSGS